MKPHVITCGINELQGKLESINEPWTLSKCIKLDVVAEEQQIFVILDMDAPSTVNMADVISFLKKESINPLTVLPIVNSGEEFLSNLLFKFGKSINQESNKNHKRK